MSYKGYPRNRNKRRDNNLDVIPSYKNNKEAEIGELFWSRELGKLVFKKGVDDIVDYDSPQAGPAGPPGPAGPQGLPGTGGGGLEGTAYVFVAADGTPIENATELKAKYALAQTMTSQTITTSYAVSNVVENAGVYTVLFSNNNSLNAFYYGYNNVIINGTTYIINVTSISSSTGLQFTGITSGLTFTSIQRAVTNPLKVSLILAPGEYDFEDQTFVISDNLVDVVSLTGDADVKFIGFDSSAPSSIDAVQITANNILVKGIDVVEGAIKVGFNLQNLVVENCKGGVYSFSSIYNYGTLSSTFNNCIGKSVSFGGNNTGVQFNGIYNNCIGGDNSFSPYQGYLSGTFNNCTGRNNSFSPLQGGMSGTFNNCVAQGNSFGGNSVSLTGTFNNCKGLDYCFTSFYSYATFSNCRAESFSFYTRSFGQPTYNNCKGAYSCFNTQSNGNLDGTFTNCIAGDDSFGSFDYTNVYATFINCSAGYGAFAGGNNSVFAGKAVNCSGSYRCFGGGSFSSIPTRITGKIINCQLYSDNFIASTYFGPQGILAGCFDNSGFIASRTM